MSKLPLFEDFIPVGFGTPDGTTYSLGANTNADTGYNMDAIVGPVMEASNCIAKEAYGYEANDNPNHTAESYIKEAKKHLNEKIDEACSKYSATNEAFEVHYSDGIRAMQKFNDKNKAIAFMKDKIASNKNLKDIAVYNASGNFHSTADTDAVVVWWGERSYLDNVSKKDAKLAAKKLDESAVTEAMVQVAGNKKPAGAQVLATVIVEYLNDNLILPSNANRKKITEEIKQLIIDSTF